MNRFQKSALVFAVALVCRASTAQQVPPKEQAAADKQAVEIRDLIERLVFEHPRASETPLIQPFIRADGTSSGDEEYAKQCTKCRAAFEKLTEFKEAAFPALIAHLKDDRPSIHFRNHFLGHSVGDACYWNIYFQLQDRPKDYSSYGYSRTGRDGQDHPKPYWKGTPFDAAGGLKAWLEKNRNLSYAEKQIDCLNWLLTKEKAIGAPDAESYFENILPLEIRILERKAEMGADVQQELKRLRTILKDKLVNEVPAELLPKLTQQSIPQNSK